MSIWRDPLFARGTAGERPGEQRRRLPLGRRATAETTVSRSAPVAGPYLGRPSVRREPLRPTYTAGRRGGKVVLETELERLGIRSTHSRPYHPQTCGKVERFHQTQKQYLRKQPAAASLEALQAQLDRFVVAYNTERPPGPLAGRPPKRSTTPSSRPDPTLHP